MLVVNDARMREVYWAEFEVDALVLCRARNTWGRGRGALPRTGGRLGGRRPRAGGLARTGRTLSRAGAALHTDLLPRASEILALARPAVAAGQILDPAALCRFMSGIGWPQASL